MAPDIYFLLACLIISSKILVPSGFSSLIDGKDRDRERILLRAMKALKNSHLIFSRKVFVLLAFAACTVMLASVLNETGTNQ